MRGPPTPRVPDREGRRKAAALSLDRRVGRARVGTRCGRGRFAAPARRPATRRRCPPMRTPCGAMSPFCAVTNSGVRACRAPMRSKDTRAASRTLGSGRCKHRSSDGPDAGSATRPAPGQPPPRRPSRCPPVRRAGRRLPAGAANRRPARAPEQQTGVAARRTLDDPHRVVRQIEQERASAAARPQAGRPRSSPCSASATNSARRWRRHTQSAANSAPGSPRQAPGRGRAPSLLATDHQRVDVRLGRCSKESSAVQAIIPLVEQRDTLLIQERGLVEMLLV